jgi:hypothetical protein
MPNYIVTRNENVVNTISYYVTAATEEDAIEACDMGMFDDSVVLETDCISAEVISVEVAWWKRKKPLDTTATTR